MTWLLTSRIGRALAGAVALLVAVVTFGAVKKRDGARGAENEALRETAKRTEAGNEAVNDLRDADRDDLNEQLQRNSDKW